MAEEIKRKALAVGAHPDDVEFLGAGTLALLKQRGFEVHIASMSPGDLGTASMSREEIASVRREEGRCAAEILSAPYTCLEATDFGIFFGPDLCRRATALLRAVNPTVVFTHAPVDYLADHEETSRIVRQACFAAPVTNYRTPGEGPLADAPRADVPTASIPHLYYFDPVENVDHFGRRAEPSVLVDVTSSMDVKERMLSCHASQREWLRKHHGSDHYVEMMKDWNRERGAWIGCEFAEGFTQHRGHAYPRNDLLLEVLAELAREGTGP